ncbi:probable receptor-like serine threonine- kinase At5g57670 [Olea europaea subsp. europaea]|uniref:Probable receptor-like serine threonine- kinase At5g57670 n=1 Tax=Olea europaea subsp. europaea TaxID=158383 RepID=A0A8S0TLQ3_OLEEU|nr:probable receptor-like serine threonine- kinase At5g57670 [Olea europaea subsp. europaea]
MLLVDLKLKVYRGSSVRKILVRETNSYCATEVIAWTAGNHHIWSSASIAKYCTKKLPKDCSDLDENTGEKLLGSLLTDQSGGSAAGRLGLGNGGLDEIFT